MTKDDAAGAPALVALVFPRIDVIKGVWCGRATA
jgi:hypothetical protein